MNANNILTLSNSSSNMYLTMSVVDDFILVNILSSCINELHSWCMCNKFHLIFAPAPLDSGMEIRLKTFKSFSINFGGKVLDFFHQNARCR